MITKVAPFTSRGYIKVCSRLPGELDQWTLDRSGSIPRRCGICHPPSSDRSPAARSESADQITTITERSANVAPGGWRADGPSDGQREAWLWADRYIPFEKLGPDDLAARTDLRRRLPSLRADRGEILEASYQGPKPPNADVENLLLYNIDTGDGCFREAVRYGVRFEMAANLMRGQVRDDFACCYRYRLISAESELGSWYRKRLLARFDQADLGSFPTYKRLEHTWAGIHRAKVVVAEQGVASDAPFAVLLELACPRSATAVAGPELVKALIDGAVSAFHAHADLASLQEIARRIAVTTGQHPDYVAAMLTNAERGVLGRIDKLAFLRGDGVQWNPSDHMCMAGQVTIARHVGDSWKLSGEVHELRPR
jgi:hypothetical protein